MVRSGGITLIGKGTVLKIVSTQRDLGCRFESYYLRIKLSCSSVVERGPLEADVAGSNPAGTTGYTYSAGEVANSKDFWVVR